MNFSDHLLTEPCAPWVQGSEAAAGYLTGAADFPPLKMGDPPAGYAWSFQDGISIQPTSPVEDPFEQLDALEIPLQDGAHMLNFPSSGGGVDRGLRGYLRSPAPVQMSSRGARAAERTREQGEGGSAKRTREQEGGGSANRTEEQGEGGSAERTEEQGEGGSDNKGPAKQHMIFLR
jgi:hypothetical protein